MPTPIEKIEKLVKDSRRVLESPFWIPELKTDTSYQRLHDDHDGTQEGRIMVSFLPGGDAVVVTDGRRRGEPLRFRTPGGGGTSLRVRNALMLLAWAIKLDNETCPNGSER